MERFFCAMFYENHSIVKGGTEVVTEEQLQVALSKIKAMLGDMKYGSITLIIQDGKIIQLEKNEKVRLK
jgi:hypothetical protein